MSTFVTGANGLLGGTIVRALVERGEHVTCLVRSRDRAREVLGDLPVELREGDLEQLAATPAWLRGIDVVHHCAAYFREYYAPAPPGGHERALTRHNVDAVRNLLLAADAAGVGTLVHISTIGVHGGTDEQPADEQSPPSAKALENLYHRSKARSEEVVAELAPSLSVQVPVVRPGWLFGPGDAAPTSSGKLVQDVVAGALPAIPPGGNHATDARDVAQACLAAAAHGGSGSTYIVAAPWQPMTDIITTIADAGGVRPPRLRMPVPVALGVATLSEWQARVTGGVPLATRDGIRALTETRRVTSARAERELGATFRPFTQTAQDQIAWLRTSRRVA